MKLSAQELRIGNYVDETGDFVRVGKNTFKLWDELNLIRIFKTNTTNRRMVD